MSDAAPRFDQRRKDWATSADALADRCYQSYFDVALTDLYDLETLVDDAHDTVEGYRTHQILDYGGVDRIVDCGCRHVYIAQRFRPTDRRQRDLSLRTDTGVAGRHPEFDKWRHARATRGFYPSVIAFGVYDDVIQAFAEFALLDTAGVLDALADDAVRAEEHPTGDGTAAVYIPLESLRRADCVIAYWDGVAPDATDPNPTTT